MMNKGVVGLLVGIYFLGLMAPAIWIQFRREREREKGQRLELAIAYMTVYLTLSYVVWTIIT